MKRSLYVVLKKEVKTWRTTVFLCIGIASKRSISLMSNLIHYASTIKPSLIIWFVV